MQTDRRSFILLIAVTLGRPALALAEQGQGLFWRVETSGRSAILFGYMLAPASLGPYIVDDGRRMIEQTQTVIRDYDNIRCPTVTWKTTSPLLPRLSPAVADEVRRIAAASGIPPLDRDEGFGVALFLLGEGTVGQGPEIPTIGGVIFDRATALRRPLKILLADDEVRKLFCAPPEYNAEAVDESIDEKLITSMLDLRRRVGPIGAYVQRLYLGRKTDELAQHFKYIADHRIILHPFLKPELRIELLFTRLSAALPSVDNPFVFLPVETLIGPGGILERFRQQGADVSVLA
jgi:hypothetical protein